MISYVLPTRNRPSVLAETLEILGNLARHDAQVVVVDNASDTAPRTPQVLVNAIPVHSLRLDRNRGTAARNEGARHAAQLAGSASNDDHWIVMLDDDSAPTSTSFVPLLKQAPPDLAVLAAEVFLPPIIPHTPRHEAGGLPEVFIGCGTAVRAGVFLALGGYDETFDYYAEEYDFAARLLHAGLHVQYDRRFTVMHRKVESGRDMNRIIKNLVRNNAWVMARYAPDEFRDAQVQAQIDRYAAIASKENARDGYQQGVVQLRHSLPTQPRRPLPLSLWQRFTGFAAAVQHLSGRTNLGNVAIVQPGKNVDVIEHAARECGIALHNDEQSAQTLLVGTLSPGPMLDAAAIVASSTQKKVITPWLIKGGPP